MAFRKVIVVYHSVDGVAARAVVGSHPISFERFKYQVCAAREKGWRFGRLSGLFEPVEADTLYITSDDGTVDWARNVLPWCEQQGIPTHTAIITGPWHRPPIYPIAHRVQVLLSIPGQRLPVPRLSPEQMGYVDKVYAYETDPIRRRLKGACNVVFSEQEALDLLGEPSEEEADLLAERFAEPGEYLGKRQADVGVHTVTHAAFDGDPERYVERQVLPCLADLRAFGLAPSNLFTLPVRPRYPATVEQLIPVLRAHGFVGVLDGQGEWDGESYVIPRVDAKNVEAALGIESWKGD